MRHGTPGPRWRFSRARASGGSPINSVTPTRRSRSASTRTPSRRMSRTSRSWTSQAPREAQTGPAASPNVAMRRLSSTTTPTRTRNYLIFLVGRQELEPWTLGLRVPSRRLSTHVHGRPPTSTGDHPITVPRFHGRPPMSTGVHRLGCHLAVISLSARPPRPGIDPDGDPNWRGASGSGKGLPAAGR